MCVNDSSLERADAMQMLGPHNSDLNLSRFSAPAYAKPALILFSMFFSMLRTGPLNGTVVAIP